MAPSDQKQGNPPPPNATYGRRTPSGENLENELASVDFSKYVVQFPVTPDNQPMEVVPLAPPVSDTAAAQRPSESPAAMAGERMVGWMKSMGEFDYNQLLFETKGTYGYGNAIKGEEDEAENGEDEGELKDFTGKPWRPLTRKLKIPAAILSPYRLLVAIRVVALSLFLTWRIAHKNQDAIFLWFTSVICELWFALSWLLDQLPKLNPINRSVDLSLLKHKFESPFAPKSDLPSLDIFVSTSDPLKEPPLLAANTILSILAADYPADKLTCYLSDDAASLLTFESLSQAAAFAALWIPFCRKHCIEPRSPDAYFSLARDPYKRNKQRSDFVRDRRRIKREYDELKVRINGLSDRIRRRSDAFSDPVSGELPKATWMADGTHWPGAWETPSAAGDNSGDDHSAIIQVMLKPPPDHPISGGDGAVLDLTDVDVRLPALVYVSREKRPPCGHYRKAGAMNALLRASAIMSNAPFVLNLDCDHYVCDSQALRKGICFMMDRGGDRVCFVQFPQRFDGVDPSDRYANHNAVFFDVNMRAFDGLQGPVYAGTGCLFRRTALYGFDPPSGKENQNQNQTLHMPPDLLVTSTTRRFGSSIFLLDSIPVTDYQGRPLADHPSVKNGRPSGALIFHREPLDASTVAEAINVVSCWYEEKTEWGRSVGWIYGSVAEHLVTGYLMHNRGWRSIYCVTKRDAFRGKAPINLTDRLRQVLRWATGSVEIFFSRHNALFASSKMKFLQRVAYLNISIYPFGSFFLLAYCFLPALSLFSGQFIVQSLNISFLVYLLVITLTLCLLAALEIRWSGIALEEWWRNEQFWFIGGTSAHLFAVLQGLLKIVARIKVPYALSSKNSAAGGGDDINDDEFADLYVVKWTWLMIPPLTIILVNLIAIAVGVSRTLYSIIPQWSRLLVGVFFSFWVLAHLYPFAKGLMGRRGKTPTVVYVWSGLIAITISLLWVTTRPPSANSRIGGSFSFS